MVSFEILFADDIEQEVSDIDSPKEYVSTGTLRLTDPSSICYFGDERSFITMISAQSLKDIFFQYSTHGLFASNLRFFITSKKIDPKIIETIQKEPGNFCYFNNGIIITCEDYIVKGNSLYLNKFSIVNGGQTTNLVGRTKFTGDFPVVCKVIKNKYSEMVDRINFLSKVAEASNTQKPINAKDLIANRPEQRMLKVQYAAAGMFLKVKRGEKIDKSLYPEAWMNASNDDVAQMIYSAVFQCPGAAKNSKSSVLGNDKSYRLIFGSQYSSDFLKSLQYLKVSFTNWQKYNRRYENKNTVKFGLSKHANFMTYALIGFLFKLITNTGLASKILTISLNDINNDNADLHFLLKQNDIGSIPLLKPTAYELIEKDSFFSLFDQLFDAVITPAFLHFKKANYTLAYAQFCKADRYYYDFVLPYACSYVLGHQKELTTAMAIYFNLDGKVSSDFETEKTFETYKPGLEEELTEYKNQISSDSRGNVTPSEVISYRQMALILRYFPRTRGDLYTKIYMSPEHVAKYGDDIIKIVKKYADLGSFE